MTKRTIELKYNIGDKVFSIAKKHSYTSSDVVCPVCNGTGMFIAPTTGTKRSCPGVSGYACIGGHIIVSKYKYYPFKTIVREISISSEGIFYIDEHGDTFNGIYYSNELYDTIEEAQAACDAKNNERNIV